MATITSTGVGSGLDVNTIVGSLMSLERRPLSTLQAQASTMQTRLSAFGTLKGQVAALGDLGSRLAEAASWNPLRVDSSDAATATATASASATPSRYQLQVQRLAQGQTLASAPLAGGTAAVVGTGSLRIEVGTTAGGAFTPAAGKSPVDIPIPPGRNTLAGVRDAINAANAGVTASILTSGGESRLVLRTPDGAASSVRITATDDDGNGGDAAGLSMLAFDPGVPLPPDTVRTAGRQMQQTQQAQDAAFTLDGIAMTSATNSPADVIPGVTLSLRKVNEAPVELTVAIETMAVRKNLNDFVTAYNSLNRLLSQQTQADPSGKNRGPLQADSTAVGLQASLRELLRGVVSGAGLTSLSEAGLEFQRDGSLQIKDAKLTPLLNSPAQLARLFGQAASDGDPNARGLGLRLKEWGKALAGDTGPLTNRIEGLNSRVRQNQQQQDNLEQKLTRTEARLRAQYQRLDTEMSKVNAQMAQMRSALGLNSL